MAAICRLDNTLHRMEVLLQQKSLLHILMWRVQCKWYMQAWHTWSRWYYVTKSSLLCFEFRMLIVNLVIWMMFKWLDKKKRIYLIICLSIKMFLVCVLSSFSFLIKYVPLLLAIITYLSVFSLKQLNRHRLFLE